MKNMVSYKKMYEELLALFNTENKTSFLCPICSAPIMEKGNEYYCSNESCKFDKTPDEIWAFYAEHNRLERID